MNSPKRYRKKAVEVEAVQVTDRNGAEVEAWVGPKAESYDVGMAPGQTHHVDVSVAGVRTRAVPGDYVLLCSDGEFEVWSEKDFQATYEPVGGGKLWEPPDGCPESIWDGPYRILCGKGADSGVCSTHGPFAQPEPAEETKSEIGRVLDEQRGEPPIIGVDGDAAALSGEPVEEEGEEDPLTKLRELQPPDYAEKDFGKGTSSLAAYRAGYFDAKQDALIAASQHSTEEREGLEGVEQIADCLEEALGGAAFKHDVRVVYVRMLAAKMVEFDAWLSFRGEFGEVLTAFRSAFGTDTSDTEKATPESEEGR